MDINSIKKHLDGSCFGWCALGIAVNEKNESMAKFLLRLGTDPNIKRAGYETLLSAAIRQSNMKAINFLLVKLGASPDTCFIPDQERLDVYPIHLAIWTDNNNRNSDWQLTKLLLRHNADLGKETSWHIQCRVVLLGVSSKPHSTGNASALAKSLQECNEVATREHIFDELTRMIEDEDTVRTLISSMKSGDAISQSLLFKLDPDMAFQSSPCLCCSAWPPGSGASDDKDFPV